MKSLLVTLLLALGWLGAVPSVVWAQREQTVGGWQGDALRYGWHLDYQAARELARRSQKPLMVVFRCVP